MSAIHTSMIPISGQRQELAKAYLWDNHNGTISWFLRVDCHEPDCEERFHLARLSSEQVMGNALYPCPCGCGDEFALLSGQNMRQLEGVRRLVNLGNPPPKNPARRGRGRV